VSPPQQHHGDDQHDRAQPDRPGHLGDEVEDGDPLDDSVYLYFDTETSELTGYYTVSDQLGTADGIRSGDGLDRLQDAYGSSLENVSSPNSPFKVAYLLRESAEGDGPALLFGGRRGLVVQIEGGDPPPNLVP